MADAEVKYKAIVIKETDRLGGLTRDMGKRYLFEDAFLVNGVHLSFMKMNSK